MKFFNAAIALCLSSNVWAAAIVQRRGTTVVGVITSNLVSLQASLPAYENASVSALAAIKASISANAAVTVQQQIALYTNVDKINFALKASSVAIQTVINTAGGVQAAAKGLAQADMNQLSADVGILKTIISDIQVNTMAVSQIKAQLGATYLAEMQSLGVAVQLLVSPIIVLAQEASSTALKTPVVTTGGLPGLVTAVATVVNSFVSSIGLGNVFQISGTTVSAVPGSAASSLTAMWLSLAAVLSGSVSASLGAILGVGH